MYPSETCCKTAAKPSNLLKTVGAVTGSLFLENGVQLHPNICLTYLANHPLPDGRLGDRHPPKKSLEESPEGSTKTDWETVWQIGGKAIA